MNWELVTPHAAWSARPGHQGVVLHDRIVAFGGFGLLFNPSDMWASRNGRDWTQVSDTHWNAMSSEDIKYDFDALAVQGSPCGCAHQSLPLAATARPLTWVIR